MNCKTLTHWRKTMTRSRILGVAAIGTLSLLFASGCAKRQQQEPLPTPTPAQLEASFQTPTPVPPLPTPEPTPKRNSYIVRKGDTLWDISGDGPFDAAYAVTVFQHIRHDIVRGYMRRTLERLVPGGRLLFSFADGDEDHFLSHQATAVILMSWMYEAGFGNVRQIPTPTDHPAWNWMIGEVPA
jgi:hypothetical protein